MAERKVHPNCVYRSNPYHECIESCFVKMEEAGRVEKSKKNSGSLILIVPRKLSFKKKKGSDSPVLKPSDSFTSSNPDLKKALESADPPLSPTKFSFKKVESWNCDLPFTSPQAGKVFSDDASFTKFLPKSKPVPEEQPADDTIEQKLVENDLQHDDDEKLKNADPISDSPGSSATVIDHSFEAVSEEESPERPIICDSRVHVEDNYYVKGSVSSTLRSILDKYGDIAKDCKLTSVVMRSYYLESLCLVVRELNSSPIDKMSKLKLKEVTAIVKDVEAVGIDVKWLQKIIDEVSEAVELVKKSRLIESEKKKCDSDMESVRKDLEARLRDMEEKEKEVAAARAQVEETREQLGKLERENSQLNETISSIKSMVESIEIKAKVDQM